MQILPHLDSLTQRERAWRKGALKLSAVDTAFLNSVDGLGRLDCSLRSCDAEVFDFLANSKVGDPGGVLTDYFFLSGLWVMGAYEILRTLVGKLPDSHPCKQLGRNLRDKFARVRIPLAKLETPHTHPQDLGRPLQLTGDRAKGWAWNVTSTECIFRNDLADEFMLGFDCFPELPLPDGGNAKSD
jgi:hypothetical protein